MMGSFRSHLLFLISIILSNKSIAINNMKTSTFLSPLIELTPGMAYNRNYLDIDFPKGHLAIKNVFAEVVDQQGNPVSLHEAYLHHWVIDRYFQRFNTNVTMINIDQAFKTGDVIFPKIAGLCQHGTLQQYWGLGTDTRKTKTFIPDPYAIEVGNSDKIIAGYEQKWTMNVHVIDTRGVESRRGCLECRCDLYNATLDALGQPLPRGYVGGYRCCDNNYHCRLRPNTEIVRRNLFVRYTVTWTEWEPSILPVKIFVLDVTDSGNTTKPMCNAEYQVEACKGKRAHCVDQKERSFNMTTGGDVVFAVGQQHIGGKGITLRKKDGSVICHSKPVYGKGREPGNEKGYVVEMTTCYPKPGTVKIQDMETVVLISKYSNKKMHTGVTGIVYLLVTE